MKYFHRDEEVPKSELKRREKLSETTSAAWKDKKKRERMIQAQIKAGLRTYNQ